MAGAGYKLFNSGDVLTAAQVNTYLQEQAVMRFADAAARTTALSGVLAEGMMSYLDDTNAVEVYNGSAWVSISADQTPLTTKGDLFTYTTTDARLGVGNNGESLIADSSATTGLRWQGNFAAGKNLCINGNMNIAQRGTSVAGISTGQQYLIDMYQLRNNSLGAATYSQETDAPAGFKTSAKILFTTADNSPAAGDFAFFRTKFEGQALQLLQKGSATAKTTTLSFWVKSNVTGTYIVNFADLDNTRTISGSYTINASATWEKKTITIAGDTTGAFDNDNAASLNIDFGLGSGTDRTSGTLQTTWASTVNANTFVGQVNVAATLNNYWMITGIQWEIGSTATDFQTATGTLAGERSACERYYQRWDIANFSKIGTGVFYSATQVFGCNIPPKVTFRATPTLSTSGLVAYDGSTNLSATIASNLSNSTQISFDLTVSGATALRVAMVGGNNNSNAYFEASAEL